MDLGWVRRMLCDGFGVGGSHVTDLEGVGQEDVM